jgi:hypothetical protein
MIQVNYVGKIKVKNNLNLFILKTLFPLIMVKLVQEFLNILVIKILIIFIVLLLLNLKLKIDNFLN